MKKILLPLLALFSVSIIVSQITIQPTTGVSVGTIQSGSALYCRSTAGNDTYVCSLTPALTAYTTGGCIVLNGDAANIGPATININSLGAKSILNRAGAALTDGDITANKPITICYDGTQFIIQGDGGGAAGANTTTGTYATNPGTCTNGDLRLPTDSGYLLRCASNIWVPWGPIYPMTSVPATGWSWQHQGTSTISVSEGTHVLTGQASFAENIRQRVRAAPAPPYSIVIGFNGLTTTNHIGIHWRESSTSKIQTARLTNSGQFNVCRYNNDTTWSGVCSGAFAIHSARSGIYWIRLTDNNTNLLVDFSPNGRDWVNYFSESRTAFMAGGPDQVGFYTNGNSSTVPEIIEIYSWKE